MSTIQCWITRGPKGEDEDEYMLHFTHPELKCWDGEEDNKHGPYWYSGYDSVNLIAQDSYGLNPGECMEWVMVKKGDFEKLKQDKEDLFNQVVNTHQSLMAKL